MKNIKLLKLTVCFTGFDFILHSRMEDDFCRCYTWLCHVDGGFDGSSTAMYCKKRYKLVFLHGKLGRFRFQNAAWPVEAVLGQLTASLSAWKTSIEFNGDKKQLCRRKLSVAISYK